MESTAKRDVLEPDNNITLTEHCETDKEEFSRPGGAEHITPTSSVQYETDQEEFSRPGSAASNRGSKIQKYCKAEKGGEDKSIPGLQLGLPEYVVEADGP